MFASTRAADQVRNSIAYPKVNVKIGATHGGISTGGDGASHQANEDIAIMRSFPNMTVIVPGDYEEARLATRAAAAWKGPVYLRFGRAARSAPILSAHSGVTGAPPTMTLTVSRSPSASSFLITVSW